MKSGQMFVGGPTVTKPDRDIERVYANPVGDFQRDAMLYCQEKWGEKPLSMDARGMSDGTLRFFAILTALLTRPRRSQIIIEEVDNGLHPSRSQLLLNTLRDLGREREIDVLVTTHNPSLLDELGPEMVPFVIIAHRHETKGYSQLTLLEDVKGLPKLMSYGKIGKISSEGKLEEAIHDESVAYE